MASQTRIFGVVSLLVMLGFGSMAQQANNAKTLSSNVKWDCCESTRGVIPNEEAAIRVVKAVLEGFETPALIKRGEPYTATLQDGIWIVVGSLPNVPVKQTIETPSGPSTKYTIYEGPFRVGIRQINGQVVSCCFTTEEPNRK